MTRLLNGMIPDFYDGTLDGQIRVKGFDPVNCSMYEISKVVGTVFQNPRTQFYTVNTTSEIAFGCENHGWPPEQIRERVMQAAADLHIEELLDRNIFELSGGEKQKIAFASIYALNPDVYVLDEPSSNLDCFAIRELQGILELLKKQGKTILAGRTPHMVFGAFGRSGNIHGTGKNRPGIFHAGIGGLLRTEAYGNRYPSCPFG